MFIPDPWSRFLSIPDPGSRIFFPTNLFSLLPIVGALTLVLSDNNLLRSHITVENQGLFHILLVNGRIRIWLRFGSIQISTDPTDLGSGTRPETISGIFELLSAFFTWQAVRRSWLGRSWWDPGHAGSRFPFSPRIPPKKSSVADPYPGSGAFLTPGSRIRNRFFPDPGSLIPNTYFWELSDNLLCKKLYNSLKIGPNFFLLHFKTKIIFNFVKCGYIKRNDNKFFSTPLICCRFGIRDG